MKRYAEGPAKNSVNIIQMSLDTVSEQMTVYLDAQTYQSLFDEANRGGYFSISHLAASILSAYAKGKLGQADGIVSLAEAMHKHGAGITS